MMNNDLISRSALLEQMHNHYEIEEAPTIEAEPVRHGRWESYLSPVCLSGDLYYRCSICNVSDPWQMTTRGHPSYCPNCGAKMDGDSHD